MKLNSSETKSKTRKKENKKLEIAEKHSYIVKIRSEAVWVKQIMNYKIYREKLLKIVEKHSKRPNVMIRKIHKFYDDECNKKQKMTKKDKKSCFKLTIKKMKEIDEKNKLNAESKLLIEMVTH